MEQNRRDKWIALYCAVALSAAICLGVHLGFFDGAADAPGMTKWAGQGSKNVAAALTAGGRNLYPADASGRSGGLRGLRLAPVRLAAERAKVSGPQYIPAELGTWALLSVLPDGALPGQTRRSALVWMLMMLAAAAVFCLCIYAVMRRGLRRCRGREERIRELEADARLDPLTGLKSYPEAWKEVQAYLGGEGKSGQHMLLVVEMRGYGEIRRTMGYDAYVKMACGTAKIIERMFFSRDIVTARSEGEYVILMKDVLDAAVAAKRAAELNERLRSIHLGTPEPIEIYAACGIAVWRGDGAMTPEELLRRAETALETTKKLKGALSYAIFHDEEADVLPEAGRLAELSRGWNVQLLPLLTRLAGCIVLIEVTGAQVRPVYVSPNCVNVTRGVRSDDVLHSEALFDFIDDSDRALYFAALKRSAATGEHIDIVYRLRNGIWNRLCTITFSDRQQDESRFLLCVVTDVSDQKKSELEALLRQKKMEMLLDMSRLVSFEVDIATHTLVLPEAFPRLYDCKELVVNDAPEPLLRDGLVSAETAAAYRSMYDRIYGGATEGTAAVELRKKGGGYSPVTLRWRLVMDDHGRAAKAVGVIEPRVAAAGADEIARVSELQARISLQEQYVAQMSQYQQELRRYRHDYKNNIIAISGLLNSNDLDGARRYVEQLAQGLASTRLVINTENPAIGALVSEKLAAAEAAGIAVETHVVGLPASIGVDVMDLCLAVGCCLDNAIEACVRAQAALERTSISLQLVERRGVIVFRMTNSSLTPPPAPGASFATSKADAANHGMGLQNVRRIVEKYGGILELEAGKGVFTTGFTLYEEN